MPQIDINTLFLVLIIVSLTVAVILAIVSKNADKSLLVWSLAYLSQAAGFLLIFLRESVPDVASVWLGNLLVSMTYSLFAAGLLKFLNRAVPGWILYVPALLFLNYLYMLDNLEARLILGGVVNAGQMLLLIVLLQRYQHQIAGRGKKFLTACFAAGITLSLIRPLTLLWGIVYIPSYDSGGFVQAYIFLGINVLSISVALGFVLMEKEQAEAALDSMARLDYLTGLLNRRSLYERISYVIGDKKSKQSGALILLDLDNFKPLNDTHGHGAGDQLLIQAAKRIQSCVREIDSVARLGGDEFVVLLPSIGRTCSQARDAAMAIANKIQEILSLPYELGTDDPLQNQETIFRHQCTASLGVKIFAHGNHTREDLMRDADNAMYLAKAKKRGSIVLS
ncbi:GGDEF domain-containing protein [Gammaproteobacteria bacterium LSUCC0112]|nr:GGDEF domain-containing protein [Gammaproteobacteria bacterium LSUCC0112]